MRVAIAIALLLLAACSSSEDSAPAPASTSQSPQEVARGEYLKTLKDQAVRYRSEDDAYKMAEEVCANLDGPVGGNSESMREQWTHSQLVLHRNLSSRDADLVITAVQNSKMCTVK